MEIIIKKDTEYKSEYRIKREDQSEEVIKLDTKTFFIHDISHYVVEKRLNFEKGFWGMLNQGYRFKDLFGKENELTDELRFVEKIVGPIQSIFMGYFKKQDFAMLIKHVDIVVPEDALDDCLLEIQRIQEDWRNLAIGETMLLAW